MATSIGAVLALAGFGLMFGGIGVFWRSRTSILPVRPASTLVIAGPYRFTRNPMYVGMTLILVGIGFALDDLWLVIGAALFLVVVHYTAVLPEEAYLDEKFGDDYRAYKKKVRRYL